MTRPQNSQAKDFDKRSMLKLIHAYPHQVIIPGFLPKSARLRLGLAPRPSYKNSDGRLTSFSKARKAAFKVNSYYVHAQFDRMSSLAPAIRRSERML